MSENRAVYPVSTMCRVLGVSPSGFYAWARRSPSRRSDDDASLTERIRAIHAVSHGIYGAPRIHAELVKPALRLLLPRLHHFLAQSGEAAFVLLKLLGQVLQKILLTFINPALKSRNRGADLRDWRANRPSRQERRSPIC